MKRILLATACMLFLLPAYSQVTFYDNAPCTTGNASFGNFIDWRAQTFTIYTASQGVKTVQSPFFNTSLTNPNINEFSQYTLKDFEPADGWELIQYDFGTSTTGTDVPYMILYNKHSGLMRVFVAFANLLGQNNAVTLELRYVTNESRSALLENFSATGLNATQNFNNEVAPVSINNFYVNQTMFWYHADFNLHYDPCVCNYETALELRAILASSANLSFTLEGMAIQNMSPPYNTDAFGRTGDVGNQTNGSNIASIMRHLGKGASWGKDIAQNGNRFLNIPASKSNKLISMLGNIAQGLPQIAGVADFLIGLFRDDPAPQPPKPLAFDINLEGNGTITSSFNYWYKKLIVPGSEQTLLSTTVRPWYNKAPGVFTLLKVPTISYNTTYSYADEWTPERHESWVWHTYKVKENISYTVNPHAGFDLSQSEITASLLFTAQSHPGAYVGYETDLFGLGCLPTIQKSFDWYRYQDPYQDYEIGWIPGDVKLQIVAKFKVAGTSIFVPYVGVYNVKLESDYTLDPYAADVLPPATCSTTLAPATSTEIKAVCNGTIYKDLVDEFAKEIKDTPVEPALYSDEIRAFPNPVQDIVNLDLTKISGNYNKLTLTIFDISGKLLMNQNIQAGKINTIETNLLAKGVYLAKITGDNFSRTIKIVKQ